MARARIVLCAVGPLALAFVSLAPSRAQATEVHQCVQAAEIGQRLRDKEMLKAARGEFITCASDACPAVVRQECVRWLADVDERLPRIVVRATDAASHDLSDVRVSIDGVLAQERLDGRRLEIDPGQHTLRFERGDRVGGARSAPIDKQILVREGEKNRFVDVVLDDGDKAARPEAPRAAGKPFPLLGAVFAGVAVLGGVGFAYFAASGQSDVDHLRTTCAPRCAPGDVDSAKTKILVANVSLGLGVLAAGAATYFFFFAPDPATVTVGARF
jgi:hypothetical protein